MGVVPQRSELGGRVETRIGTPRQVEFDVRLTSHTARKPREEVTIVTVVACLHVSNAQVSRPVAPGLIDPGHSQPTGSRGAEVPPDGRVGGRAVAKRVERRPRWAVRRHVISPSRLREALQRGHADIISQVRVAAEGGGACQRE